MFVPLHDDNRLEHVAIPFVNLAIIALTTAVFLIFQSGMLLEADMTAAMGFGMIPAVVTEARSLPVEYDFMPSSLSLVTYAFVHGGWWHLIGNMLFIWVFGDNIEDALGHIRYILFYLLVAAAGGLAEVALYPEAEIPVVGASGAASGLVGAYLVLHPNVQLWVLALGRIPVRLKALWVLAAWFIFQIVLFVVDDSGEVAWGAHIGGFCAGAVLIVLMRRKGVPLFK